MTRAALGLGANLGDPAATLAAAVRALDAAPGITVVGVSALWRTAPVGGPEQPEYANAVVIVETEMTAEELLALAHALEADAERIREVRWGPRTLDVDLLDMVGVRRGEAALTVPHPRAHERAFVLAPWAALDPAWPLEPVGHPARPVAQWAAAVADDPAQPVAVLAEGTWWR
ncbi:MAG TPA: 2-amino-4-hydroxy-6-hydroxymethyldihydropteridine diphosphokinase [Candidatus Nanopelagicales bacterium]